jgi:hypothetical protein
MVGLSEGPVNNRGPLLDDVIRQAGGKPGQAWCSYMMIYVFRKCKVPIRGVNGMALSWAKPERAVRGQIRIADLFTIFNKYLGRIGHVGMVYTVYPEERFFLSFEGNINARGDRESTGSVAGCLIREYSVTNGFWRWAK